MMRKLLILIVLQGDISGQQLHFVDFDLVVPSLPHHAKISCKSEIIAMAIVNLPVKVNKI